MVREKLSKLENQNPAFRWRDVPRAIWYFLEEEKLKFSVSFIVLFLVFFYDLVPAYIAGKIVDFFTHFQKGDSLHIFYFYVIFLGVSYVLASLIRLKSKNVLSKISIRARARARIWGFERLTEFSLAWHAKENTGSKIQRIYTGSQSLQDMVKFMRKDFLRISAAIIGVTVVFLFLDISFVIFVLVFLLIFLFNEYFHNRKIVKLSDAFNVQNQRAGGVYVEGAGNMLALKAMGGEQAAQQKVRSHEESAQEIGIKKTNTNNRKWRIIQTVNGLAFAIFFLLIGKGVVGGGYNCRNYFGTVYLFSQTS